MKDEAFERTIADDSTRKTSKDNLEFLRDQIRYIRDLEHQIQNAEEKVKSLKRERLELQFSTLPALFMSNRISSINLDEEGNVPAYEAKLTDYYKANIEAEWPLSKREKAFAWLKKHRLGDIIKTVFTIEVGMGNAKLTNKVEEFLKLQKIPHRKHKAVPWNSLTSAVKEFYRANKPLSDNDLETLGARVGKIVTLKQAKDRQ